MENIVQLRDKMDSNGYAHFNYDNFKNGIGVCYIPENGDEETDIHTRETLMDEVNTFINENPDYLFDNKSKDQTIEEFKIKTLENLWMSLEWEYPSTALDQMLNF